MKARWSHATAIAAIAVLSGALLGAAPTSRVAQPGKLVVLSTTDVKGKNEPCGCHIPKGGLSRRTSYRDSIAAEYGQVLFVDNGGFFPDEADSLYRARAEFLMTAMSRIGIDAAGMSEKELKYGRRWLLAQLAQSKLPMVCANVWDKSSKKTLVPPYRVLKKGAVTVGVFGLTSDQTDLGPARDSLTVEAPVAAAQRTVAELRKKGATVVVLLSQLGKVESEDLVSAVDGIDVLIAGRNVPMLQKGRMIKSTIACYGGEQGHFIGRTLVSLDAAGRMRSAENDVVILGPEVAEAAPVLALVKSFNDHFNDVVRERDKRQAAEMSLAMSTAGGTPDGKPSADHFVGAQVCQRCHQPEYDQWLTTSHAKAWQTLVDVKREATPECVSCHVVGFKQAGGFHTADDASSLANVQCENCHGMGTQHDSYSAAGARKVAEETCRGCHTSTTSPVFDFAVFQPHIAHQRSGELPPLPHNPAKDKMKAGAAH